MRIIGYILSLIMIFGTSASMSSAESADAVLKRAAASINGADGIAASFTIDYGSQKLSGTLKSAGKMFALQTSASSTWYDGKSMWTYNPKTNETTLMTPTPAEVAEANPLSIVNSYASSFTAAFAKTQKKGSKTIVLTPKSKHYGYKSVHVTIADGASVPSVIVVVPASGQKMTVSISQVKMHQKFQASTFTYPKSKFPKAEIVDMR